MANWTYYDKLDLRLSRGLDRPLNEREIKEVWEMSILHTPDIEMAYALDFRFPVWIAYKQKNPDLQDFINKGRAAGSNGIRKAQYEAALRGNVTMLMWLGRAVLGQNRGTDSDVMVASQIGDVSPESKQHLLELRNAIYGQKTIDVPVELTVVNSDSNPATGGPYDAEA